jgi:hypothetical protein
MVRGIDCLASQNDFFVKSPLDIKESDEHALDFSLHFPLGGLLLCVRAITINPALITNDNHGQENYFVAQMWNTFVVPLSDPSRNRIRPDSRL